MEKIPPCAPSHRPVRVDFHKPKGSLPVNTQWPAASQHKPVDSGQFAN
jgi:hypothetical protein